MISLCFRWNADYTVLCRAASQTNAPFPVFSVTGCCENTDMQWIASAQAPPAPVAGLDIGDDAVRIVELSPAPDGWRLAASARVALPAGAMRDGRCRHEEAVVGTIVDAWHHASCVAEQVVLALPAAQCVLGLRRLPARARRRLAAAAARRLVPPGGGYCLDYQFVASSPGQVTALLCAAPRDAVEERVALAEQAGLATLAVDIDCLALLRAARLGWPGQATALLALDAAVWRLTRLGAAETPAACAAVREARLPAELLRRLAAWAPTRVLLNADDAPELAPALAAACGIEVRAIAAPAAGAPGFALACGLAQWQESR
jgi:hypothetical protein